MNLKKLITHSGYYYNPASLLSDTGLFYVCLF